MVVIVPGSEADKKLQQQPLLAHPSQPPQYNAGPSTSYQHPQQQQQQQQQQQGYWPPAPTPPAYIIKRGESARTRFCKALLVGVLIWVLLSVLLESMFNWGFRRAFTIVRPLPPSLSTKPG